MTIMIMIIIQTQTLAIVSKYKPGGGGTELNRTKQRWLLLVHLCFNMISRYGTIKYIRGNYQINHEFNRYDGFQRHSQTKSSYPIITRSSAIDRPVAKVIILVVKQSNYKFSKPINSVWWINNKAAYSKKEWLQNQRGDIVLPNMYNIRSFVGHHHRGTMDGFTIILRDTKEFLKN